MKNYSQNGDGEKKDDDDHEENSDIRDSSWSMKKLNIYINATNVTVEFMNIYPSVIIHAIGITAETHFFRNIAKNT